MSLTSVHVADRSIGRGRRLGTALLIGGLTAAWALTRARLHPEWSTDFDQMWYAARALMAGNDPYEVVGPGRAFDWTWQLFYPLPGVLAVTPLAMLPLWVARVVFSAAGGFVVGYAIAPQWKIRWPLLLSMAFFSAISRNQWSPFVLAAAWIPIAGAVVALKPNVGLLTLAVQGRRALLVSLGGALVIVLASFAVRPTWFGTWLAIVREAPNKEVDLLQPVGFLLLASLVAWRSVEGRALFAMSIIPHTPSLYELLPTFIVTTTTRQSIVLAALTHVLHWSVLARGPYADRDSAFASIARAEVVVVLLPVLAMLLYGVWSERSGPRAPVSATPSSLPARVTRWFDRLLIVLMAVSLGIQIWIVT